MPRRRRRIEVVESFAVRMVFVLEVAGMEGEAGMKGWKESGIEGKKEWVDGWMEGWQEFEEESRD